MNAIEIEDAISLLAEQDFDPATFAHTFLEGFGDKPATIKHLKSGNTNSSDVDDMNRFMARLIFCLPVHQNRAMR